MSSAEAPVRKRILVVDDDEDLLELLGDVLSTAGFEVELATTGAAALQKLREQKPDLLLTDFELGEMSGIELAKRARKLAGDLPVLVLTGHGGKPTARSALAKVADVVLAKPIDCQELVAAVKRLVEPPAATGSQLEERRDEDDRAEEAKASTRS